MDKEKNLETQANDNDDPPAREDFLDFELEIGTGSGRVYPVAVVRSAAGEVRGMMQFPYDDLALENQLLTLQNALLRSGGKPRHILLPEEQNVQDFGLTLFNTLFSGAIGNCYAVSQREADLQGKGLRVKLRILSPELAAIPWEFLYDPSRAEYVCLSRNTPVVRYLELPQPPQPLPVTLPLRILGMIATPTNLPQLDVQREQQRMEKALEPLEQRGLVQLTWLAGQTWRDVQQAMREGPWHIFHFIGHGSFDPLADEGLVAFTDEQGQANLFRATQLARLLSDHRLLRLVVLNACESAKSGRHDVFSSTAANLVRHGIPAVLAMQYTITDAAAIVFSRAFYEALADGMPIDAAVSEARKAVSFEVENTLEWGIPVLFMRSPDGVLFTVSQGPTPALRQPPPPVTRPGAVLVPGQPFPPPVQPRPTPHITQQAEASTSGVPSPRQAPTIYPYNAPYAPTQPTPQYRKPRRTGSLWPVTTLIGVVLLLVIVIGAVFLIPKIIGPGPSPTPTATSVPVLANLSVNTTSLNANTDCQSGIQNPGSFSYYQSECSVTLSSNADATEDLSWTWNTSISQSGSAGAALNENSFAAE